MVTCLHLSDHVSVLEYLSVHHPSDRCSSGKTSSFIDLSSSRLFFVNLLINLLVLIYWFYWQSEYIAPRDARLAWMSGFTGSAGVFTASQL